MKPKLLMCQQFRLVSWIWRLTHFVLCNKRWRSKQKTLTISKQITSLTFKKKHFGLICQIFKKEALIKVFQFSMKLWFFWSIKEQVKTRNSNVVLFENYYGIQKKSWPLSLLLYLVHCFGVTMTITIFYENKELLIF
jgi:hypothetical protein